MLTDETKRQIFILEEINCRIDAIKAAVEGVEMNDTSQQKGISGLLGDIWCRLDGLIVELKGETEGRNND